MALQLSVDVLVVGGGPAGVAAAVALSRTKRIVALYDSGLYRNANAVTFHTVPGHEGESPHEWRQAAQSQLIRRYPDTCTLILDKIVSISKSAGSERSFAAKDASGRAISAKKVILATGVEDKLADVKGLPELWGKQAIHCVYCHGTETAGKSVAVLLTRSAVINKMLIGAFLKKWRNLRNEAVYILTNGIPVADLSLGEYDKAQADYLGVTWETLPIEEVLATSSESSIEIVFRDNARSPLEIPFIVTFAEQIKPSPHALGLFESLNADLGKHHPLFGTLPSADNKDLSAMNPVNPATLMEGVYWAGNSGSVVANVNIAVVSGQMAGTAADDAIAEEEMIAAMATA